MQAKTVLIIGASRGLGQAMAETFIGHGWNVIGTVRQLAPATPLHQLALQYPDRVRIEMLDICDEELIAALAQRLHGQRIDMLFVNAGTTNRDPSQSIGDITTEEFLQIMLTNALAPMRVIEQLEPQVTTGGLIGVMSSGQGSIANNESGQRELYRGSKAALNMFMRSLAARPAMHNRPMVTMAPGWIKTDLGGPDAPYTIAETIPSLVNVLLEKQQRPGLEYLDFRGNTVPW